MDGGRRTSVRTVLLAVVIGVSALGIVGSEAISFALQLSGVRDRTDAALRQEVEEFRQFAATGVDPQTGESFTSLDRLLLVTLQRNVPDANETFLTLLDGRVRYLPRTERPVRLEDDPAFVQRMASLPEDSPVVLGTDEVQGRRVRFAAVPVRVEGDPATGLYVIAYDLDAERADVVALLRTAALVDGVVLLVVAVVGFAVAGRLLRPVRAMRDTARRISESDLSERIPVSGRDDLSELAATFNAMLDRLEQSFALQRRFLDDAGHELRTPVTILRGHLELLDPEDPAEVRETRALLLDELDRMSRLVEDLVVLAKSRRPDFAVPRPVDAGALVRGALEKARALGDRRWRLDEVADVTAVLDGQRLEQALLQLASNAVRHTGEDGTVALGSRVRAGRLEVWVRDDGEGIAPEDHARVFERFGRLGTGRGSEGSGLGLAIVAAIADSAGGRVHLSSRLGEGSRFVLDLPLVPARQPAEVGP